MRSPLDMRGSPDRLVDNMVGTAYPVVREVARNIEYVKHVSHHLPSLYRVSEEIGAVLNVAENIEAIRAVGENSAMLESALEGIETLGDFADAFNKLESLTLRAEAVQDGASAYEVALGEGFVGSSAEWLESMRGGRGNNGKSVYQSARDTGFTGTEAEFVSSLRGRDGQSAYTLWLALGNTGSEQDFIASLQGESSDVDPALGQRVAETEARVATIEEFGRVHQADGYGHFPIPVPPFSSNDTLGDLFPGMPDASMMEVEFITPEGWPFGSIHMGVSDYFTMSDLALALRGVSLGPYRFMFVSALGGSSDDGAAISPPTLSIATAHSFNLRGEAAEALGIAGSYVVAPVEVRMIAGTENVLAHDTHGNQMPLDRRLHDITARIDAMSNEAAELHVPGDYGTILEALLAARGLPGGANIRLDGREFDEAMIIPPGADLSKVLIMPSWLYGPVYFMDVPEVVEVYGASGYWEIDLAIGREHLDQVRVGDHLRIDMPPWMATAADHPLTGLHRIIEVDADMGTVRIVSRTKEEIVLGTLPAEVSVSVVRCRVRCTLDYWAPEILHIGAGAKLGGIKGIVLEVPTGYTKNCLNLEGELVGSTVEGDLAILCDMAETMGPATGVTIGGQGRCLLHDVLVAGGHTGAMVRGRLVTEFAAFSGADGTGMVVDGGDYVSQGKLAIRGNGGLGLRVGNRGRARIGETSRIAGNNGGAGELQVEAILGGLVALHAPDVACSPPLGEPSADGSLIHNTTL